MCLCSLAFRTSKIGAGGVFSDAIVMNDALIQYTCERGTFKAWELMRQSTKWHTIPRLQVSKQSKMDSSIDVGSGHVVSS
ncbi:unnamed protein product [Cuscuta campestris]|uniref:Uncharacterized protein n=1 Tax=Cuscuta campestris TaxID=132261 RepID=A0A484LHE2_9ASTE|nr:unnamed protein product [Cuscuta campestris]